MIGAVKEWVKQPFSTDMNLTRWTLFTGLILVLVILWGMVLRDLKDIA